MILEIAHRGDSHYFMDNSKEAFLSAIRKKYDMIELDIQLSKDGIIFIFHDIMIDSHILNELTFEEIQGLNSSILSLSDFFQLIDNHKMKIYLDIKALDNSICKPLVDFLEKYDCDEIYLASFNVRVIEKLFHLNPQLNYGMILENLFPETLFHDWITKMELKFICFHWTMLNQDVIHFLQKNKVKVFSYTCKTKEILSYMLKYNIDGIVTNYRLYI